ncbi:MAG: hypothetical protein R3B45_13055 [Bdellovibrionota bacterium]
MLIFFQKLIEKLPEIQNLKELRKKVSGSFPHHYYKKYLILKQRKTHVRLAASDLYQITFIYCLFLMLHPGQQSLSAPLQAPSNVYSNQLPVNSSAQAQNEGQSTSEASQYFSQFNYESISYKDTQENELKLDRGELTSKISTLRGSLGALLNQTHLLSFQLASSTTDKNEWKSRTEYKASYGLVIRLFGEIIPTVGLRSVKNDVELDKQRSPKISTLGSNDYFAGVYASFKVFDFAGVDVLLNGGYLNFNPGNSSDFGNEISANIALDYRTGAYKMTLAGGMAIERYQASQKYNTENNSSLSVEANQQAIILSLGVWYTPAAIAGSSLPMPPDGQAQAPSY